MRNCFLILVLSSLFFSCKKDSIPQTCINQSIKDNYVTSLSYLENDTTQVSAAERAFLNDIRITANNISTLSSNLDTMMNTEEYYNNIRANFLNRIDSITQKASIFYHGDSAKVILTKNTFVLMSYDALQRTYPEFMWVQLGVFVAEDVRLGLVLALNMRHKFTQNNFHLAINGMDINDALLQTCNELINGQLNVLTDIGPFAIMNRNLGAAKMMQQSWLSPEAKQGFMYQQQAEDALNKHNCFNFYKTQTLAAIQFGAHEQIYILQPMWNAPLMQQFSFLNNLLVQITNQQIVFFGDIFIGVNKLTEGNNGYTIKLPSTITSLANAQQRIVIAKNGFNTLNQLRQDTKWNDWLSKSQVKIGYASGIYKPDF